MKLHWMYVGPVHLGLGALAALGCLLLGQWSMALLVILTLLLWFLMSSFGPPAKRPVVPAVSMAVVSMAVGVVSIGVSIAMRPMLARYLLPIYGVTAVSMVMLAGLTILLYLSVTRIPAAFMIALYLFSLVGMGFSLARFGSHVELVKSLSLQVLWKLVEIVFLILFMAHEPEPLDAAAIPAAEIFR